MRECDVELVVVEGPLDERDAEILEALRRRAMGVSEIARALGFSKSVVSRKVRRLVALGLVERVVVDGAPLYRARGQ